jgi:XapX domain-containing protein
LKIGAFVKLVIGLIVAVCIGIGCRWFGIPLPGPPAIMGAAMAVAMASGYTATDYWLSRKTVSTPISLTKPEKEEIGNNNGTVTAEALHRDQQNSGI